MNQDTSMIIPDSSSPSFQAANSQSVATTTPLLNTNDVHGLNLLPNLALWDGDPVLPFPLPLIKYFPDPFPEIDLDGVRQWFMDPAPPKCDQGYFEFCCNEGAPDPTIGATRTQNHAEVAKRRRKCNKCTFCNIIRFSIYFLARESRLND